MGIGKITLNSFGSNVFKTKTNNENTQAKQTTTKASNPFGVSFKGNVIHADVFESSKTDNQISLKEKAANRGKLFISAVVGNINNFNDSIKSRMNSIVSFGRQLRDNTAKTFNKIGQIANTEINIDFKEMGNNLRNAFMNPYSVNNLSKRSVGELEAMLLQEIE